MFYSILLQVANTPQETDVDYKLIMTLVSALSGALIGGGITVWHKRKEIKNLSETLKLQMENLNLQKDLFQETVVNNELKIKAELVRLEDLNRQYQLSLQKYDFEHLSKVLDFAGDSNEKVKMLKDFSKILKDYNPNHTYYYDQCEYEEYIINHVYYKLDFINTSIIKLLHDYPAVFNTLHDEFKSVSAEANYLIGYSGEISSYSDDMDEERIINQLAPNLLKLHESFYDLLKKMQQEFLELDTLKKNYIRSQFTTRTQ
ncbi:hypothetical protein [Flavobacterium sp.]|jgi:hypothetical protein|uniref:hypothetical protein n=1 Tax=Flavobacterium sp. TaxID=239 RepID=UPI0037BF840B